MSAKGDLLVGCTGFVGQNLQAARSFARGFHSRDVDDLRGAECGQLWCAAMPGTKWKANQDPDGDRRSMERLQDVLGTVRCGAFVLISTIDVMLDVPYGRHRREFEQWVAARFADHCVVRLPALFGRGLEKNVLFDLLTDHMVDRIHPGDAYQWYDLADLVADVEVARRAGAREVDLYTEPVENQELLAMFPGVTTGAPERAPQRYAHRSRQAGLFGRDDYVRSADEVRGRIAAFVAGVRAGTVTIG